MTDVSSLPDRLTQRSLSTYPSGISAARRPSGMPPCSMTRIPASSAAPRREWHHVHCAPSPVIGRDLYRQRSGLGRPQTGRGGLAWRGAVTFNDPRSAVDLGAAWVPVPQCESPYPLTRKVAALAHTRPPGPGSGTLSDGSGVMPDQIGPTGLWRLLGVDVLAHIDIPPPS